MTDLDPAVQNRIDQHLDAIDRVLAGQGMSRAERVAITDDVETQIREMLAAREASDLSMVEAVLAELDPPEAYGAKEGEAVAPASAIATAPPRLSRVAVVGAIWIALALAAFCLTFTQHKIRSEPIIVTQSGGITRIAPAPPSGPAWWQIGLLILVGIPGAAGTIGAPLCGLAAIGHIRHSRGQIFGLPLALFDALLFPLLLLDALAISLIAAFCSNLSHGKTFAIGAALCLVLDAIAIRWVWSVAAARVDGGADVPRAPTWPYAGTVSLVLALVGLTGIVSGMVLHLPELTYGCLIVQCSAVVCGVITRHTPQGKIGASIAAASSLLVILLIS